VNDEVEQLSPEPGGLNRPWRALVAFAEALLAAVAVIVAFPLWHHGVKTLTMTMSDGTVLTSTRFIGSWMSSAIGLGMVAAILLADAVREVLLATGTGARRHRAGPGAAAYLPHLNGG
jgi:hypothetical protein